VCSQIPVDPHQAVWSSDSVCAGNPIVDMARGHMPRPTSRLQEFARIGAAARIKELQAEIDSIRRDFHAPTAPGRMSTMPSPFRKKSRGPAANLAAKVPSPRKRRRKMSAEARKKISEAHKKAVGGSEGEEVTRAIVGQRARGWRSAGPVPPRRSNCLLIRTFRAPTQIDLRPETRWSPGGIEGVGPPRRLVKLPLRRRRGAKPAASVGRR
jgi:hypothetical protein